MVRQYPLYAQSELELPIDLKWDHIDNAYKEIKNADNLRHGSLSVNFDGYSDDRLAARAAAGYFNDNDNVVYGDRLLGNLMNTIDQFRYKNEPLKLRPDQQTMIANCIVALLPLIFGPQLNSNRERLLKKFHLKRICQEVIIIASRRVGKSILIACILAALLLTMPGVNIATFSPVLRQSRGTIMKNVIAFINSHPDSEGAIREKNSERIEVKVPGIDRCNSLMIFPDREEVCFIFFVFSLLICSLFC